MIKRELAIFLVVGASTVLVDFICYRGLIGFQVMEVDMAKATGFLVGTLFAYFANRFWTFGHKSHIPGSAWRFSVLYASTLGANVLINALALKLLADYGAKTREGVGAIESDGVMVDAASIRMALVIKARGVAANMVV